MNDIVKKQNYLTPNQRRLHGESAKLLGIVNEEIK